MPMHMDYHFVWGCKGRCLCVSVSPYRYYQIWMLSLLLNNRLGNLTQFPSSSMDSGFQQATWRLVTQQYPTARRGILEEPPFKGYSKRFTTFSTFHPSTPRKHQKCSALWITASIPHPLDLKSGRRSHTVSSSGGQVKLP